MEDGDRENECYVAAIKERKQQSYTLETKRKPIMSGKCKTDSVLQAASWTSAPRVDKACIQEQNTKTLLDKRIFTSQFVRKGS